MKKRVIKETGEWDDNDEQFIAWKDYLNSAAIELASKVKGEARPAEGFDAYQGPYAHISDTPKGTVTLWCSEYEDIFNLETSDGWLEGDIETLAKKLKESAKPDTNKKPTKRLVMNQGNVYIFEQSKGSKKSYIVGEDIDKDANTIEKVNKYNSQEEAFTDFFARVGIDPNNELKESIQKATGSGKIKESAYEDCIEDEDITEARVYTVDDIKGFAKGTPVGIEFKPIRDGDAPITKTAVYAGSDDKFFYFYDGSGLSGIALYSPAFIESGKVVITDRFDGDELASLVTELKLDNEDLKESAEEKKVTKLEVQILPELKFLWAEGNQKHVANLFGSADEHTMDFTDFQNAIYKLDQEIQNETNPDGSAVFGYDKVSYLANIRCTETYSDGTTNTEDTTYQGRVDCGDGRYGLENVRVKDLMKSFIQGESTYKEATIEVFEPKE